MANEWTIGERRLRALSHPLRSRMVDLLAQQPATASELARTLGVTSGTTSYHLRELEKAGLIVDLADRGNGRDRVWHSPFDARNFTWSDQRSAGEIEYRHSWLDLRFRSAAAFHDRVARDEEPEEWRAGPVDRTDMVRMSPDQLRAFTREVQELVGRWSTPAGTAAPPEPGTRVVEVQFRAFPVGDAAGGDHDNPDHKGEPPNGSTSSGERD